jgi:rare lipoprotein A
VRRFRPTRRFWLAALALAASASLLSAQEVPPAQEVQAAEEGLASWYGGKFQGRRTASGEPFDTWQLTAAHKRLPFGALVLVTNLENGKSVIVRINDRGPFVPGRVIDLSQAAAVVIGLAGRGVASVRLEVLGAGGLPAARVAAAGGGRPTPGGAPPAGGAPAASGSPGQASAPAGYCLQIGAFRQRANAERCLERLRQAGFSGELEAAVDGIFRVVISGVAPEELRDLQERLSAAGWASLLRAGS